MARRAISLAALVALACVLHAAAQDSAWAARRLPWYGLPGRELIGGAPVSLPMPAAPGACGAISDRLEPFAARGSVFLRLTLRAESGAVSISLRRPDAAAVLSRQRIITPADRVVSIFFRVDPGDSGREIVLCQASKTGEDSRVDIESLGAAFVAVLPPDEAAKTSLGLL